MGTRRVIERDDGAIEMWKKETWPRRGVFVDELETTGGLNDSRLDGRRLRDMFDSARLDAVTVVAGMKRFSNIVGDHRWRLSKLEDPLYSDVDYRAQKLVQRGEYFPRILTSLGFNNTDELDGRGPTSQPAIEPAK